MKKALLALVMLRVFFNHGNGGREQLDGIVIAGGGPGLLIVRLDDGRVKTVRADEVTGSDFEDVKVSK